MRLISATIPEHPLQGMVWHPRLTAVAAQQLFQQR